MGVPLLTTGSASEELVHKGYVDTAVAGMVSKPGDEMTGPLAVEDYLEVRKPGGGTSRLVNWPGNEEYLQVENTSGALRGIRINQAAVETAPSAANHIATKQYVDTGLGTKSATGHTHAYSADTHTHAYLPSAGGTVSGNLKVDSATGFTAHSPGDSVASMGALNYAGTYGMRFTQGWAGNAGALAPLQIGAPIDGNSAATVAWVQGDRAAASHGTHVSAAATVVVVTDGNGNVAFGYGSGTPVVSNGDWGAMQRAPHIASWGGGVVTVANLNPSAVCRLNVLGA